MDEDVVEHTTGIGGVEVGKPTRRVVSSICSLLMAHRRHSSLDAGVPASARLFLQKFEHAHGLLEIVRNADQRDIRLLSVSY